MDIGRSTSWHHSGCAIDYPIYVFAAAYTKAAPGTKRMVCIPYTAGSIEDFRAVLQIRHRCHVEESVFGRNIALAL